MQQPHGVVGKPDPDFTPDPNKKHVWDEEKQVWRLVDKDEAE